MANSMELSQETLETIGSYIRRNLAGWLAEIQEPAIRERDLELRERTVRVEEELKAQRELMRQGFEEMEKRFEQVDKRFEQHREDMFARFDDMHRHTNRWMTVLSVMIGLIGIAVTVSNVIG